MSKSMLQAHRDIWQKKPALRKLYSQWYDDINAQLVQGPSLEIGGGSGNLKKYQPNVICTDIVSMPWLDLVADAQSLPFKDSIFSNIVLFDVLHHIENPIFFFKEALRVLNSKGRILIMDPYISMLSWPIYNYLHQEPVDFSQKPLEISSKQPDRKPFDSNQAISTILFKKQITLFTDTFPELKIRYINHNSFFVYLLSGGFDHPSLIPNFLVSPLLSFERFLKPLAKFFAFRIFIVLGKKTAEPPL